MRRLTATIVLAALSAACTTVGPDHVRPGANVPLAYREGGADWKRAEPRDAAARGRWWEAYGDARLDGLVERVNFSNQTVLAAEARVRQAQAAVRQASAALYPGVTGGASANRNRASDGRGGTNVFDVGVDAAWEADVWGRVRRSIEVGETQWQALAADLESVRLAAIATLVQSYLALRVIDAQAGLLSDTVAAYSRSLQLTRNRYNVGVAGKSDLVLAEAQVKSTQAQLVDLGVQRAQLEHAIAVLVGEPPAVLALAPMPALVGVPAVPPALPSELLERRPDIAAAERRVAAANAQIGVAQAALYPSVELTGSTGLRSSVLPQLLGTSSWVWGLGAAVAQSLFDGGARRSVVEQAKAAWEVQVATYRQTVLTGFQEVEDNLAALRVLAEEAKLQDDAVRASRESVALTENRYKAGTASYLDVIAVQTIALGNERTAVTLHGRRLAASVALVRALGGGWDAAALAALRARADRASGE